MKVRVPVWGTVGKCVSIEANPITQEQLDAAIASVKTTSTQSSGPFPTLWKLIREIPLNIVSLAALASSGIVVRKSDSSFLARSISVADSSRLTVANADGTAGNPTLDVADIASHTVLARDAGTTGKPAAATLSAVLDFLGSVAQGDILYRAASSWAYLAPGNAEQPLWSGGASANPSWGRKLIAGGNITFDDTVAGQRTISAAGGGGSADVPGTIDDLVYWFRADTVKLASGGVIPVLMNWCPWFTGLNAAASGAGATRSATQQNSHNAIAFPASSAGRYPLSVGYILPKATIFMAFKPKSVSTDHVTLGGPTNALQCGVTSTGKFNITKSNVASIASATTGLTLNAWVQCNVTYDSSSGAYAFRQGSATNGSGTNAVSITAGSTGVGWNVQSGTQDANIDLGELIVYQRVLSGTEIANIENYLFGKWGV